MTRRSSRGISTLVAAVLLAGASVAWASPAAAACQISAGKPYLSSDYAKGSFQTCGSGYLWEVSLQRHRWYGWESVAAKSVTGNVNVTGTVASYCKGTGTYTYRTVVTAWVVGAGDLAQKVSTESRFTC